MIIKNSKINKSLTFGVIIIVCFVYTINTQPAVFGCISNFFQIDDHKNIMNDMSEKRIAKQCFMINYPKIYTLAKN